MSVSNKLKAALITFGIIDVVLGYIAACERFGGIAIILTFATAFLAIVYWLILSILNHNE